MYGRYINNTDVSFSLLFFLVSHTYVHNLCVYINDIVSKY